MLRDKGEPTTPKPYNRPPSQFKRDSMDEAIEIIGRLPKEIQERTDAQYKEFTSKLPIGYVIGVDLSNAPDQTGWMYNKKE